MRGGTEFLSSVGGFPRFAKGYVLISSLTNTLGGTSTGMSNQNPSQDEASNSEFLLSDLPWRMKCFCQGRRYSREGHQGRPLLFGPCRRLDWSNVTTQSASKRLASTDTSDNRYVEKRPAKKPKSKRRRE